MIRTEKLAKTFPGSNGAHVQAVAQLDLEVAEGTVFGFLGPNGAGKTTTVRMLSALIAPTSGTARVNGYNIGVDNEAIRGSIGILTELPGLYDRLSAWQNLIFYARLYDVGARQAAIQTERYLRELDLWERRDDKVGGFSKGMKQKLAIARALLHEPQVVFLDEPTSALDPEAAKVVRDFIAELKTEGRTIFLCTHNLDEADRLADRIGIMKQRLIQVDTAENLRRKLYGRRVSVRMRAVSD